MILYTLITFALNGSKMCITTANTSYMADVIDYELDRSGEYIPAVIPAYTALLTKSFLLLVLQLQQVRLL